MITNFLKKMRAFRYDASEKKISEMKILYVAKLLRFFAVNLAKGFIFMYVYKLGYGWSGVILSLILVWFVRISTTFAGGKYIAKHGPKHGILLANILSIPLLISIGLAKEFGVIMLIFAMILEGASVGIYNLAYYVEFSKVEKGKNASKQLGMMLVIEKATHVLAPIIGAWLSANFGPHSAMFVASGVFAFSAVPLLATREITKNDFRLNLKTFPVKNHWRNFFSHFWIGTLSLFANVWAVFVPIYLFSKENAYGVIGVLASFSAISSMILSFFVGRLVSRKNGAAILGGSILGRGLAMILAGIAVFTKPAAILLNLLEEFSAVGYKITHQRGAFSDADKSARRVEYFMLFELAYSFGSLFFAILAGVVVIIFGANESAFRILFVLCGIGVLGALTFKFPAFSKE